MKNFKIEINFQDLVDDMFVDAVCNEDGIEPSSSFNDALKDDIVRQVSKPLIASLRKDATKEIHELAAKKIENFVSTELDGIITRKLRAGEIVSRWGGFKSFDELIEKQFNAQTLERIISKHIDAKSAEFAKDMKSRYDNIFAAKIVSALKDQKMLSPDVASLLLGGDE